MTLSAQLTAAQTQNTILQAEIERATLSISAMKAEVEVSRQKNKEADEMAAIKVKAAEDERDRRIAEIEDELRTAETIRRKLHNQVQELKGGFTLTLVEEGKWLIGRQYSGVCACTTCSWYVGCSSP
jgi:kinesin family protein C1